MRAEMTARAPERPQTRSLGGLRPLAELTRARILEFVREPEAIFWVFVFPVLMALALGIAFRSRPAGEVSVGVVVDEPARATIAAELGLPVDTLIARLEAAPGLDVQVLDSRAAALALRKARVGVVMLLEPAGPHLPITYRFDESRPEGRAARLALDDAVQRALGRQDVVATREQPVAPPGSRYIDFLIPGLVGLNLMGSGMWGIGFSIVSARTRKLLKRFAATPMRRSHYLASFALSRLMFLALEVIAVVGFGWVIFGVRVRGSLLDLALVSVLGAATFAGIGLLVAARPKTIEGVSGWMNLVMLPMWLLSGTFFSYERFPALVLPLIRALPLTALNDSLRAVMNDGLGLAAIWGPLLILLAWGGSTFLVAVRIFRWQ
jgi:ABC-2 type transport system permease protein